MVNRDIGQSIERYGEGEEMAITKIDERILKPSELGREEMS